MTDALVVATYNVHRFRGVDGVVDPVRVAHVIAELRADLVTLQEADMPNDVPVDDAPFLRALTGYQCVVAPTLREKDRLFGNVLLSRLPVLGFEYLDLSHRRRERRLALDVTVDAGGTDLRVLATHLGLWHFERHHQVGRLLRHLEEHPAPFLAVLGDFNDWLPGAPSLRRLERHLGFTPRVRTFPSFRPLLALDRVWVHPGAALLDVRAHRSPLARRASDHLPVVARVARPEPPHEHAIQQGRLVHFVVGEKKGARGG